MDRAHIPKESLGASGMAHERIQSAFCVVICIRVVGIRKQCVEARHMECPNSIGLASTIFVPGMRLATPR